MSAEPSRQDSTPAPQISPPPTDIGRGHPEFHFVQALLSLQQTIGHVTSSVERIEKRLDRMDDKMDGIDDKITKINAVIYAAGAVLAVLLTIGGFVLNKAWDSIASHVEIQTK